MIILESQKYKFEGFHFAQLKDLLSEWLWCVVSSKTWHFLLPTSFSAYIKMIYCFLSKFLIVKLPFVSKNENKHMQFLCGSKAWRENKVRWVHCEKSPVVSQLNQQFDLSAWTSIRNEIEEGKIFDICPLGWQSCDGCRWLDSLTG